MWVEPFWGRRWEPGRRNWPLTRCGCLVAAHASREPGRLERGGNARTLGLPGSVGRGAGRCPGQRCGTGNALIAQGAEMPTRLASPGSIDVTFDMPPDAGTRGRDAGASTRGHLPPRGEDSGAGRHGQGSRRTPRMDGQARRLVSEATQCETTGGRGSPARLTREPNLLPGLAGSTAVPVCAVLCRCTASHRIASHRLASNRASAGKKGGWRSWWWWAHPLRGQNAPAARFVGCTHARQQDNETTGLVRFGAKCSAGQGGGEEKGTAASHEQTESLRRPRPGLLGVCRARCCARCSQSQSWLARRISRRREATLPVAAVAHTSPDNAAAAAAAATAAAAACPVDPGLDGMAGGVGVGGGGEKGNLHGSECPLRFTRIVPHVVHAAVGPSRVGWACPGKPRRAKTTTTTTATASTWATEVVLARRRHPPSRGQRQVVDAASGCSVPGQTSNTGHLARSPPREPPELRNAPPEAKKRRASPAPEVAFPSVPACQLCGHDDSRPLPAGGETRQLRRPRGAGARCGGAPCLASGVWAF
ncbi:hypothetical protein PCL_06406 [Purpureocillium lilacinum]|uniref:Uncharacterized protein n=1 Tax=Purpureocillium lilacinum TaxID=33203 RepID=A0A2U3EML0_PURLI|nr:hypothetical protein PCL_06406 [Purpureocillium lilacinum]